MEKKQAQILVKETFENSFDKQRFVRFAKELLNFYEAAPFVYRGNIIPDAYDKFISSFERIGKYSDGENEIDILIVNLKKEVSLERARTAQRNFIAWYLNGSRGGKQKDGALVAFVAPDLNDWRFSLVKMDYKFEEGKTGKVKIKQEFTPARRWSFLVGANENSHTAQSRLAPIVENDNRNPSLKDIEEAFNIELVTKEFFEKYRDLFLKTKEFLDDIVVKDERIRNDFEEKSVDITDFSKKLLGQIIFLYFLQKKGWFGVSMGKNWGDGDKKFLRNLFNKAAGKSENYFNDYLEPLFYEALAKERDDNYYSRFICKIPFLNGGLFDPINNYDWVNTAINLPNELFSNDAKDLKTGDIGSGILDIFDRYNFTVKEDEPLEKEVAIDPEMLGKVFENLLEVKDRKSKGTYYTPREIVHYMCQQSLINYLASESEGKISNDDLETLIKDGEKAGENELLVENKGKETDAHHYKLPESIRRNAAAIDEKLASIKVCDPAIGSGAFPVGMMNEIVKAREALSSYLKGETRTVYNFKRDCIQNSLYGVDIDPGAVEIAKLRLWLSLIVDEDDIKQIKPLPNLDYKIMQGNSLLEEYEGIKLFNEKLLQAPIIYADNLNQENQKIIKMQSELLKFYVKHPEWMHRNDIKKPIEIMNLENRLSVVLKSKKRISENSANQKDLFTSSAGSTQIRDELEKLHKKFFEETNKTLKENLKKRIDDLEWDLIEATLEEQNKKIQLEKIQELKKTNIKPFFLWKLHFSEVFKENGGFDVIIANPPYVRQEEIDYKPALQKEYEIFNSVSDLYTYFYERGVGLLKNSGTLTFITSNKFLRARYGVFLRNYLNTNTTIKSIINFGDQHIFDAITNTLIFISIKQKYDNGNFNYSDSIDEPNKISFPQSGLQDSEWTIENTEIIGLKNKIERLGTPLKDWDIRINRGLLTGYNDAFIINETTKDVLIKKDSKAEKIIKPIIRGRDIKRFYFVDSGLYLIVTHNGYRSANNEIIKAIDINKLASIKSHLDKYSQQLKDRQDKGATVYNLRDCAFMSDFAKEKIIWIELTNENKFAYSDKEDYLLAGAFFLVGKSLKYLLAFLNSKLCLFYFSLICNSSGMATIQWKKFALEKVPVIKISDKDQKPFIEIVDKILAITKIGDYLENPTKKQEVKEYENQINQMVYQLYGLTPEEIKIVEE